MLNNPGVNSNNAQTGHMDLTTTLSSSWDTIRMGRGLKEQGATIKLQGASIVRLQKSRTWKLL